MEIFGVSISDILKVIASLSTIAIAIYTAYKSGVKKEHKNKQSEIKELKDEIKDLTSRQLVDEEVRKANEARQANVEAVLKSMEDINKKLDELLLRPIMHVAPQYPFVPFGPSPLIGDPPTYPSPWQPTTPPESPWIPPTSPWSEEWPQIICESNNEIPPEQKPDITITNETENKIVV